MEFFLAKNAFDYDSSDLISYCHDDPNDISCRAACHASNFYDYSYDDLCNGHNDRNHGVLTHHRNKKAVEVEVEEKMVAGR
ncbi:MAG: hypothetical protein JRJ20_16045 [Deltaproteobacteria bacterium]|nr:hypothetical protein [Deltaproteobacteria bacterium]